MIGQDLSEKCNTNRQKDKVINSLDGFLKIYLSIYFLFIYFLQWKMVRYIFLFSFHFLHDAVVRLDQIPIAC